MGNVPLMDGLIRGTLVLTPDCAFIEANGARELIVWPYAPVFWRWDHASEEIISLEHGPATRQLRFGSGDPVELGGGHVPPDRQTELVKSMIWLVPPEDECMTSGVFISNGELSTFEQ